MPGGTRRIALAALLALAGAALAATSGRGETSAAIPEALPDAPPLPATLRAELARNLAGRGADYEPRTRHRRADGAPLYTNRLLLEASPYLQQHAHNPVDWRPWGDEAFADARRLKRPVLVSIGYSTCHWCHVMEEESFDDVEIARLLNAHFIAIKVDREVRPDIDATYMTAIQALGSRGGWPLNVWVTPDRQPFYAGTYFPPQDRDGRPGLITLLRAIHSEYASDPGNIEQQAAGLAQAVRSRLEGGAAGAAEVPGPDTLERAAAQTLERIDWSWGGAGPRPKFPSGVPLRFLLRYQRRSGDAEALRATTLTLEKMASGGIHDHVGGGFHRYSTDPRWLVPHFEKMLYDNARLALVYLEAWQATGQDHFAAVTRDVLDYLQREMTAPGGGFYSATDADSRRPGGESEEGWFFTWTPAEIEAVLGSERARVVGRWFGVTAGGNFEGRNVLHVAGTEAEVAAALGLEPPALRRTLEEARPALYAARQRRPAPLRDEKIVASWNGLAISAFARAGLALAEPGYRAAAERAADFVLGQMRVDGRLRRVHVDGRAAGPAFLEDYAFLIEGLIDLYETARDPRWLREALALQNRLDTHYADAGTGGYYQTADDQEAILGREKPAVDGALPSGNSVAALNLLRLADLTSGAGHRERALGIFSAFRAQLERAPGAFGDLLLALDYHHDTAKEIVLVEPPSGGNLEAMLGPLRRSFVPNRVLSVVIQGPDLEAHATLVPLVDGKRARSGRVTAYVCEDRVCELPTEEPEVFARQIGTIRPLE